MSALLKVKIITPKEVAFEGDAVAITFPAELGEMQVLQGHIPVLARVVSGIVRVDIPDKPSVSFAVNEGFVRVTPNEVSLLVDATDAVPSASA